MRLIDADALFDNVLEAYGIIIDESEANLFMKMIMRAPTVNPESLQPQWIPVTERMPREHQIVVGWTKDNPFSCYREEVVTWNGKGWVFVYAQRYVTNVKYWMPLPKPYKPEGLEGSE